jgi:hypothetical protein
MSFVRGNQRRVERYRARLLADLITQRTSRSLHLIALKTEGRHVLVLVLEYIPRVEEQNLQRGREPTFAGLAAGQWQRMHR